MNNFLRWYQYIVSAVSLQAVTWAVIALLRNLLTPYLNPASGSVRYAADTMALQLAVIIIGLPIFLVHWLWAERSQFTEDEETRDIVRPLYIFFMLSAFLVPFLNNSYNFIVSAFNLISGQSPITPSYILQLPDRANLIYTFSAIVILAIMWFYHYHLANAGYKNAADTTPAVTVRRLYVYLFTAVGLAMTSSAAVSLLRWVMAQFSGEGISSGSIALGGILALILTGVPLWILFWRKAQSLFASDSKAEQSSLLRKFYLYLAIFLSVMAFVTAATLFLAGIIRRLLALAPQVGGGYVFSVIIVSTLVWAYHFLVLREDTEQIPEGKRQAALRRLYWYLVAAVGLLALLIGIGGVISLFLSDTGLLVVNSQKEQLAYYTAALIAGLIVWIIPWIKVNKEINQPQPTGPAARLEPVRTLYLYFFVLIATLAFLGSTVFILSQLLSLLLGARETAWDSEMSLAAAYALLAVLIWLYHGYLLRQDRRFEAQAESELAAKTRLVIINDGDGAFARQLTERIQKEIPTIAVQTLSLKSKPEDEEEPAEIEGESPEELLAQADLILGSWTMMLPYAGEPAPNMDLRHAVAASSASRLLIPKPEDGWQWSGVDSWDNETAVENAVTSVKQFIAGEEIHFVRPRSAAAITLIVLAALFVLFLLFSLGISFIG